MLESCNWSGTSGGSDREEEAAPRGGASSSTDSPMNPRRLWYTYGLLHDAAVHSSLQGGRHMAGRQQGKGTLSRTPDRTPE
jgi:hypothetical protein